MGCIETKPVNVNLTVFQILKEYPKKCKELKNTLDLKSNKWKTWSTCFQHDVYPPDFLSSSSEKMITEGKVAILVEPFWSRYRNIIIFYRNTNGEVAIKHISLPGDFFENPIEITSIEEICDIDNKVEKILVTHSWFFLTKR